MVGLFVAMATVLGLWKSAWLNEVVAFDGSIAGKRQVVRAEAEVVCLPYLVGVVLAFDAFVGLGVGGQLNGPHEQCKANYEAASTHDDSGHSKLHHDLPG